MNLPQITRAPLNRLVVQLQNMIARINTVWGKEHRADGSHMLPKYIDVVVGTDIGASNFSGSGAMTLTPAANIGTVQYWKHGDCYHIEIVIAATVGGVVSNELLMTIPGGFVARRTVVAACEVIDGGITAPAVAYVLDTAPTVLRFARSDRANFTAGAVSVHAQITFRTTV